MDAFVRRQRLQWHKRLNFPTRAEAAKGLQHKKGKCSHGSSSRFIGVSWHKQTHARIYANGKMHHLGLFSSQRTAAAVYDQAAAPLGRALNFLNTFSEDQHHHQQEEDQQPQRHPTATADEEEHTLQQLPTTRQKRRQPTSAAGKKRRTSPPSSSVGQQRSPAKPTRAPASGQLVSGRLS